LRVLRRTSKINIIVLIYIPEIFYRRGLVRSLYCLMSKDIPEVTIRYTLRGCFDVTLKEVTIGCKIAFVTVSIF